MSERRGRLYICATPIGNLEDITLRCLSVLRSSPLIAAEDTRHTRKLLAHYNLRTRLVSYHEHNEARRRPELLKHLLAGRDLALVTDAGMPTISDPGCRLVESALAQHIPVSPVPGPSAVTAALACCGLRADSFVFEGFLPRAEGRRRSLLVAWQQEARAIVFFETPNRLPATMRLLGEVLGDRPLAILRELTKMFEEIWRGTARQALEAYFGRAPRGEYTLVLGPIAPVKVPAASPEDCRKDLKRLLDNGLGVKEASARMAERYGLPRRQLYQWALDLMRRQ